ncbi:hypothetical protein [Leptospirillum sp. Group II 'CF-1']|nr:hypothetical protein [Leptospirillum sp. Group II 'CF-1']
MDQRTHSLSETTRAPEHSVPTVLRLQRDFLALQEGLLSPDPAGKTVVNSIETVNVRRLTHFRDQNPTGPPLAVALQR